RGRSGRRCTSERGLARSARTVPTGRSSCCGGATTSRNLSKQRHRLGGQGFALADRSDVIGRGRLQANGGGIDVQHAREVVADGLAIGREPRDLGEQCYVHVLHRPFGAAAVIRHFSQQVEAASILVLRIVVGKRS